MSGWAKLRTVLQRAALVAALAASSAASGLVANGVEVSQDQLQATMLLQVLKFVEWPQQKPPDQLRICVLGGGRVLSAVEGAARNESWHGRPIVVAGIDRASETDGCHVIYVAAASEREIQSLLEPQAQPLLTVARREGFARRGGMVNFVHDRGRIALEVNPAAGERQGIRFSSKLLRLVRIVQSGVVN